MNVASWMLRHFYLSQYKRLADKVLVPQSLIFNTESFKTKETQNETQ